MNNIVNFNRFKYSREDYYIDVYINKNALYDIEEAIEERLSSAYMSMDEQYAYLKLKNIFQISRRQGSNIYAEVRLNKCFIRYIKSLYAYFRNIDSKYMPLRVLSEYLEELSFTEKERINNFSYLSEDIKLDVLSYI